MYPQPLAKVRQTARKCALCPIIAHLCLSSELCGHNVVHKEGVAAIPTVGSLEQSQDRIFIVSGLVFDVCEEQVPIKPAVDSRFHISVDDVELFTGSGVLLLGYMEIPRRLLTNKPLELRRRQLPRVDAHPAALVDSVQKDLS